MSARLTTKLATTIAVLAVAAGGASYASADSSKGVQIPANLANFREPGSTGYVPRTIQVTIPATLANFREPGSTGFVPAAELTVASSSNRGLDWVSAVIGAGAALGLAVAGAGAFVAMRKRRTLAHA